MLSFEFQIWLSHLLTTDAHGTGTFLSSAEECRLLMDEVVNPFSLLIIAPILITPRASHQECRTGLPLSLSVFSASLSLSQPPQVEAFRSAARPVLRPEASSACGGGRAHGIREGALLLSPSIPLPPPPPLPSRCAAGRVPRAPPGGARSGCHVWLPSQGTTAG
jgi:hypothetical protein